MVGLAYSIKLSVATLRTSAICSYSELLKKSVNRQKTVIILGTVSVQNHEVVNPLRYHYVMEEIKKVKGSQWHNLHTNFTKVDRMV